MPDRLSDLKAKRDKLVKGARKLVDEARSADRDLSDTEQGIFDDLTKRAQGLESDIARQERLIELEKATLDGRAHDPAASTGDFAKEARKFSIRKAVLNQLDIPGKPRDLDAGREIELQQECRNRADVRYRPDSVIVPMETLMQRAAEETRVVTSSGAASLIANDHLAGEVIDLLRAQLVIRQVGARFLTGLRGDVEIPRLATGAAPSYIAEEDQFGESTPTTNEVTMTPHFVGEIVSMSWKMLLQSSPAIETLIRDDLTAAMARAIDGAVINGATASDEPQGLVGNSGITTVAGSDPLVWSDILLFRETVELANATPTGWLANPRLRRLLRGTEKALASAVATDAARSEPIMTTPSQLDGLPFAASTLVPDTLNTNTETVLILGDFGDLLVGSWSDIEIMANPYRDADFTRGRISLRATAAMDSVLRRNASFAKRINIPRATLPSAA
ncbi:MAG: phage major capsid protein [Alphaproteobacteria bacterium]